MKKLILLMAVISVVAITSCKKEEPEPQNGSLVFWWGNDMATAWTNGGVNSITVYVKGSIAGSSATNIYYPQAPECNKTNTITFTNKPGTYYYEIMSQTNTRLASGSITLKENTCNQLQLVP